VKSGHRSLMYVAEAVIPSRTANSLHVMKMCEAFARAGMEVTLVIPDRRREREPGVGDAQEFYGMERCFAIKRLPWGSGRHAWLLYAVRAIVYAFFRRPGILYTRSMPVALAAVLCGRRCIFESHAPLWNPKALKSHIFRSAFSRGGIARLVVISEALRREYAQNFGLDPARIVVAHDAASPPPDHLPSIPPGEWPGRGGALQVGYVGHLYEGKGVEVIERIAGNLPEMDFHVIGGLEPDIARWKNRLLAENVHFHGFIPQAGLPARIRALDVCLLPNQKKVETYTAAAGKGMDIGAYTSPLKMFEYMAHGKAIVASDLPVLREVLNSSNALLVDPEDGPGWERALRALQDRGLRARLGARAYEDFIKTYTWDARARWILKEIPAGRFF
jgi:glycosyltransferase involved in cell wall biosynthesis